jgi:SAM-dependent methyltransferase
MLLKNVLARVWTRILEIPSRGLPRGMPKDTFDAEHGTDTAGIQWWTNPRSENFAQGIRYEPCSPEICKIAIDRSGVDPKQFCFLDIGCGKGRPLIIASQYGFENLIGIDYSARLCRVAERNLRAYGVNRFQIFNVDATQFDYPAVNTFAFLHHPFHDDVLRVVLQKMQPATSCHQLVIAYAGDAGDVMFSMDWLEQVLNSSGLRIFRKL